MTRVSRCPRKRYKEEILPKISLRVETPRVHFKRPFTLESVLTNEQFERGGTFGLLFGRLLV